MCHKLLNKLRGGNAFEEKRFIEKSFMKLPSFPFNHSFIPLKPLEKTV